MRYITYIVLMTTIFIILFSHQASATCNESWIPNDTECNGVNYTVQYYDFNDCNTTIDLPLDNGSIVNCSFPPAVTCGSSICLEPIPPNTMCCMATPQVVCSPIYNYNMYDANSTLIDSGLLVPFTNGTYYFNFSEPVGTYYIQICDGSTRQVLVQGDTMIGFVFTTDQILIIAILIFVILSIICAIWLHEAFFGLTALLFGLLMGVFINYNYPQTLDYICIVFILIFAVMWILIGRRRQ